MDEAVASGGSDDVEGDAIGCRIVIGWGRRLLVERAVGPVGVVVVDVVDDEPLELAPVPDDRPIK